MDEDSWNVEDEQMVQQLYYATNDLIDSRTERYAGLGPTNCCSKKLSVWKYSNVCSGGKDEV